MTKYRNQLPQLDDGLFITDGGLETTLLFHENMELPHFAAFDLLKSDEGMDTLHAYFLRYVNIARGSRRGIVLESATWRANADWGDKLGYDAEALAAANRQAVDLLVRIREDCETHDTRIVVSGCVGPRGDGYRADSRMSADAARAYHARQIDVLAQTEADMAAAFTLNYVDEAIGIVRAARNAHIPVAISFTLETDGRLPSGASLAEAIEHTDDATDGYPVYYKINCAHPAHFEHALHDGGAWTARIRGLRANASKRSHAELDECADLDIGDPHELGAHYRKLRGVLPRLAVVGGCCGTDHRHVQAISDAFDIAHAAAQVRHPAAM
jgi:S-methylmethionine-dependent homocysteine/selenocysteine methylase